MPHQPRMWRNRKPHAFEGRVSASSCGFRGSDHTCICRWSVFDAVRKARRNRRSIDRRCRCNVWYCKQYHASKTLPRPPSALCPRGAIGERVGFRIQRLRVRVSPRTPMPRGCDGCITVLHTEGSSFNSKAGHSMGSGVMAAQRTLNPLAKVRVLPSQPTWIGSSMVRAALL